MKIICKKQPILYFLFFRHLKSNLHILISELELEKNKVYLKTKENKEYLINNQNFLGLELSTDYVFHRVYLSYKENGEKQTIEFSTNQFGIIKSIQIYRFIMNTPMFVNA